MSAAYWLACIPALVAHELAHYLTARALGLQVKRFGLSWLGPYIVRESGLPWQDATVAAAGPLINLALAAVTSGNFRLVNLMLGVYNLIPMAKSDGGRILRVLRR